MDIALTKEMENFIQQQVQSGLYKDASDVVRDALRHLARNTEPQWLEEEMRKLLPVLADVLGENGQGRWALQWVAGE